MSGMKFDDGKLRWSLLRGSMTRALEGVLSVLEFGAKKYAKDSWLTVPDAKTRYRDALDRHLAAIDKGEEVDAESGKPHLFHVACNALFLAELGCREQATAMKVEVRSIRRERSSWSAWCSTVLGQIHSMDIGEIVTVYGGCSKFAEPRVLTVDEIRKCPSVLHGSNLITWKE